MSKVIVADGFEFPQAKKVERTIEEKKQRRRERNKIYQQTQVAKYIARGVCISCAGPKEDQSVQRCSKCRRVVRSNSLKCVYGISLEEYEKLLDQQNNVCWICKQQEMTKRRRLHVDHCHKTGKVRGLLCVKCNSALGGFRDSPELLERAIEYLKTFSE